MLHVAPKITTRSRRSIFFDRIAVGVVDRRHVGSGCHVTALAGLTYLNVARYTIVMMTIYLFIYLKITAKGQ